MLKIDFTQEDIDKLHYERYPHPLVQKKMEALYLKSQGIKHKDICSLRKISRTTLINSLHKTISIRRSRRTKKNTPQRTAK